MDKNKKNQKQAALEEGEPRPENSGREKKEEECPLCEISEETIKRLKEKDKSNKDQKTGERNYDQK